MDIATIFGIGAGLFLIIFSIYQGGDLGAFINGGALMIVFGGTVAAAFINYPLQEVLWEDSSTPFLSSYQSQKDPSQCFST